LAIEPGAVIRFDGYYKLRVEGRLISIGEEKSMIVFTSNMENPKQGDWNRIEFNQAEGDSKLSWARVEWANRGVDCEVSSPLLEHGVIRHAVTGLVANSGSDPRIEGNWVSDCEIGVAVEVESDPLIYGNVITGSEDTGISVKISSAPRVENNWMAQNWVAIRVLKDCNAVIVHNVITEGWRGIMLANSQAKFCLNEARKLNHAACFFSSGSHVLDFHLNNIVDNPGWSVYLDGSAPDVDATNNWWGTTNSEMISSKIRDKEDLPQNSPERVGEVLYEPFEATPVAEAGLPTAGRRFYR
jgi:parallel beta-helix repeat protein